MGRLNPSRPKKELYRKRRLALFKKANELAQSGADVYLVIRRCKDNYSVFNSGDTVDWPPTIETAVRLSRSFYCISRTDVILQKAKSIKYTVSSDFDLETTQRSAANSEEPYVESPPVPHNSTEKLSTVERPSTAYTSPASLKEPSACYSESNAYLESLPMNMSVSEQTVQGPYDPLVGQSSSIEQSLDFLSDTEAPRIAPDISANEEPQYFFPPPRMLICPVTRPPVLETSPSDVRASQALTFTSL